MSKNTKCRICEVRPIGSDDAKAIELCNGCYELAGWENTHNDDDHDRLNKIEAFDFEAAKIADLKNFANELRIKLSRNERTRPTITAAIKSHQEDLAKNTVTDSCWVCRPELDTTAKPYTVRKGTSRSGLVRNVPARAAGEAKAMLVSEKLAARYATRIDKSEKDRVVLELTNAGDVSFRLSWTLDGHYLFNDTNLKIEGKTNRKVRNVSELLRTLAPYLARKA